MTTTTFDIIHKVQELTYVHTHMLGQACLSLKKKHKTMLTGITFTSSHSTRCIMQIYSRIVPNTLHYVNNDRQRCILTIRYKSCTTITNAIRMLF